MNLRALIAKKGFWIIGILYLIILFFASGLPVFWDMYGQVKTAHYYLQTNFRNLLPDNNAFSDNGHFPVYAMYLAVLFKWFGFKLWVAHLSVLPFLLGVLWQLQKFCLRFLNEEKTFLVLVLTLVHPAFITQSIYFSNEIAIVFFSLLLINACLYERASHIALAAVFLCLFNLRGISLCLVLFFYFLVWKKNRNAWYLICGLLVWLAWLCLHYKITGWFFQGETIKEYRAFASGRAMLKNVQISLWKLLDLGSVFGWATLLIIAVKRKTLSEPLALLFLVSASVIITCVPTTNPISNRYFLLNYILVLPAFMYSVGFLEKKLPAVITVCFALVLFSNNGVAYPNRYGNAWDCSLKSLPYFELREQLDAFLAKEQIPANEVAAGFQLYFNDGFYLMNGSRKEYRLLSDTQMPATLYVADSDICNNYNETRNRFLEEKYTLVKTFKKGAVYINLYKKISTP